MPSLFQVLGCDTPEHLVQGTVTLDLAEVNKSNMMAFLQVIEDRTN